MTDDSRKRLLYAFAKLTDEQRKLVNEIAEYLTCEVSISIADDSDLVSSDFADDFANRLLLHHATHEEKFKKKAFEFAFAACHRQQGSSAEIVNDPTNPGADVIVDGTKFSLKTEASASIRKDTITISKLMEARWIRDCKSQSDFHTHVCTHVTMHLSKYDRIVVLRAFDISSKVVEYELVEIPLDVLQLVGKVKKNSFSKRTKSGGSRTDIFVGDSKAFGLSLDGSVEKVTVSGLRVDLCKRHASWTIPSHA